MWRPAKRLVKLLALSSFVHLLALRWPALLLLTISLQTALLLLAILDAWPLRRRSMPLAERMVPEHFFLQRQAEVVLRLKNPGKKCRLLIDDSPPESFVSQGQHAEAQELQNTLDYRYTVLPRRRGAVHFGILEINILSPLGLVWRRQKLNIENKFEVLPDWIAARDQAIKARIALQAGRGGLQRRMQGEGREFASLRPYQRGDDVRWVDWKATARRGQPIVKRYQPERHQNLLLLIDAGRQMTGRALIGSENKDVSKLDSAIAGALAMAAAAIDQGDRVGLLLFDSDLRAFIAPKAGLPQLRRIAKMLAGVRAQMIDSCYECALRALLKNVHKRSLICLFTDLNDSSSGKDLALANRMISRRHMSFVAAIGDPSLRALSEAEGDVDVMLQNLAARNILQLRERSLQSLRLGGSRVIEAPAELLAQGLIGAYFEAKLSGRL